jgi:small-conductance mechanosensitive channel
MKHMGTIILFLLTAVTGAVNYFRNPTDFLNFGKPLGKIWLILLIILASSIVTLAGINLIRKFSKKEKAEVKQSVSVYKYLIAVVLFFSIFWLLYGIIGPAITSIGLLAAGLTLALQKPIMNFAGWMFIVSNRPYKIGDRVDLGSISGYVHEIDLMHTHLNMVDKEEPTGKVVYIPNEFALTQPIVNYTIGSPLVWDQVKIKVTATTDIEEAEKKLLDCVNKVMGKEMEEASKKLKADIKIQSRISIEYSGTTPYFEMTVRYLANARNISILKTQISKQIINDFKKEFKG